MARRYASSPSSTRISELIGAYGRSDVCGRSALSTELPPPHPPSAKDARITIKPYFIVFSPADDSSPISQISLAIAAAEAGRRAHYGTLAGLIESLTEASAAGNLSRRPRVLTCPALLAVDKIGCLPVIQDGAVLLFQLINTRHERASTVPTSDRGIEEWGAVPGDEVVAAALIDRLVHHCHFVQDAGSSEPAAGRPGASSQGGRGMTAGQTGCKNGARRPLRITGPASVHDARPSGSSMLRASKLPGRLHGRTGHPGLHPNPFEHLKPPGTLAPGA